MIVFVYLQTYNKHFLSLQKQVGANKTFIIKDLSISKRKKMTFSHLYRFPLNLSAEGLHRDDSFEMKQNSIVQWKPLNVITLGQR